MSQIYTFSKKYGVSQKILDIKNSRIVLCTFPNIPSCGTHPFQPLEVFPEKADGIFWTGDAQLDDALLQDLLDVCKKILIIVPAGIGSLRYTAKMCSTVL